MKYFDYAATAPISPTALEVYIETAQQYFGNTESTHQVGRQAQQLLKHCRNIFSQLTEKPADSLIFTSGGTESNQLALKMSLALLEEKNEVLVSPLEHPSILHLLKAQPNIKLNILPLDNGRVTLANLESAFTDRTGLVVLQHVNSVTGIIQDISDLANYTQQQGALFHCDCVQSFGKLPLPENITSFSTASHKIGGSKGSGLLYLSPEVPFKSLYPGTTQEKGFRGGTTDLPAIAAFTQAAKESFFEMTKNLEKYQRFQQLIFSELPAWNHFSESYAGITGLFSPKIGASDLVAAMDQLGFCLSTTSACNSHDLVDPSLEALALPKDVADRYFRISFGKSTTKADVTALIEALKSFG